MTPEQLSSDDGLLIRDSGPWAKEKLYYVARYISIFNNGMKNRWPLRGYIDLMAGPGRCIDRGSAEEFDGSPLLAVKAEPGFTRLVFVEADADAAAALAQRIKNDSRRCAVVVSDCNQRSTIEEVRARIDPSMLSLCFVDNLGLNVTFETIRMLVDGNRPIDLIFTFQVNDLTRNVETAMNSPEGERFDRFFGSKRWRDVIRRFERGETARSDRATALADFYGSQLGSIGYTQVEQLHRIMKNTKSAHLYLLLLASRHPKATEFFRKIAAIEHDWQRGFHFS